MSEDRCQDDDDRINMDLQEFKFSADHRHGHGQVVIHDLMPYLDDYIMTSSLFERVPPKPIPLKRKRSNW